MLPQDQTKMSGLVLDIVSHSSISLVVSLLTIITDFSTLFMAHGASIVVGQSMNHCDVSLLKYRPTVFSVTQSHLGVTQSYLGVTQSHLGVTQSHLGFIQSYLGVTQSPRCYTESPGCYTELPGCYTELPGCYTE